MNPCFLEVRLTNCCSGSSYPNPLSATFFMQIELFTTSFCQRTNPLCSDTFHGKLCLQTVNFYSSFSKKYDQALRSVVTQTGPIQIKSNRKCPSAGTRHFHHTQFRHCLKQKSHYVALNRGKNQGKGDFCLQSTLGLRSALTIEQGCREIRFQAESSHIGLKC